MNNNTDQAIESDALKANLLETAVDEVSIDPAYEVLIEVVSGYKGILNNLNALLYEISHPFRNWNLILPKLRTFVLKNCDLYRRHENGPQALELFTQIFSQAIKSSQKNVPLLSLALESYLAYLDKQISTLDDQSFKTYEQSLARAFTFLYELDDPILLHIVQGHHPVKKISREIFTLAKKQEVPETGTTYDFTPVARLLKKILTLNYNYWLSEEDPFPWFTATCGDMCEGWKAGQLFNAISHGTFQEHLKTLKSIHPDHSPENTEKLLALPSHMDIVKLYKEVTENLGDENQRDSAEEKEDRDRFSENRKLLFLFRIMDTAGLGLIHEETLREINRSLVLLIKQQTFEEIESFLLTTFKLLKANVRKYPHTSMQCIQVLGTEVFNRGNSRLVETFLWETVRFGFQYANVVGVDEDWQPITNPAHLANIRVWLNLIMQEPKWCATLFSALIINLKLTGTCIKDTDLFQRDISRLLNHPVEPVYNLVKQFTKLIPVFFNEIGAEGLLRDVSTEADETHKRKDLLIHFLRKQSHVESSNLIVGFIEAIFDFWRTREKAPLSPFLPEEILRQIKTEGPFIDELHKLIKEFYRLPEVKSTKDLLNLDDLRMKAFLDNLVDIDPTEKKRFQLLVSMYKLLDLKYNLGTQELKHQLEMAVNGGFPEMETLIADLEICDTFQCLASLLDHLEGLQAIILSPETFEAKEDIYHKRHIATDIPSVYGRYRERKFDALGLTFRLENMANIYLEKLPETVNLSFITRATFIRILKCLRIYIRALRIDGITSRRLETYISLLATSSDIKRFSFTQYLDIFRGLSEGVKDVIYAYYTNIHQNNLSIILPQIHPENMLQKYNSLVVNNHDKTDDSSSETRRMHQLSETFLRDLISGTFGLQLLDNFITRIYQTLERQKESLDEQSLDLLMTYNPENAISFLHKSNPRTNNLIHLGNKGYNLTQLASEGKPVPPGFIITTEIFRCWPVVSSFSLARDEFMFQVRKSLTVLENLTGRRFGDTENPLLLSVRSGAAISMPGMMATIHNVGLNQEIVEEFAKTTGKEYLAWDNYRRFLQSWAMTRGVEREVFQSLMDEAKQTHGVSVKRLFLPEQMKALALEYQKTVRNIGTGIPDDPWLQLTGAVEMVLDSWNTPKTKDYRSLMDVSESWGTAVIVQTMVFGNKNPESGSGVLFTAHPYRKVRRVALWGDYAPGDQGEDIVSGLVTTYPVSLEQAAIDGRSPDNTLEVLFPEIYNALLTFSRELVYEKGWNPQEIEFTFESPEAKDLYILQTRDMITIKKKESFSVFAEFNDIEKNFLGKGIGVSGSALSGRAVFSAENIETLRKEDPDTPLILIRQDTVPEDIRDISMADGLLTARGGQTSHAAVVTLRLEKTCVVGCHALKVYETEEYCEINDLTIRFGDPLSIDGRNGLLLKGRHPIKKEMQILPL
ncbi:MAG: phosphoenolpyruvate synthase [Proteobacteria bacterium]|nr:phosphoenolpyruvate synthase [Pseudomonadota bacterium]MBU1708521.1 phosphoenolpyruvate synthase [Pseudomonadota bacterium]